MNVNLLYIAGSAGKVILELDRYAAGKPGTLAEVRKLERAIREEPALETYLRALNTDKAAVLASLAALQKAGVPAAKEAAQLKALVGELAAQIKSDILDSQIVRYPGA